MLKRERDSLTWSTGKTVKNKTFEQVAEEFCTMYRTVYMRGATDNVWSYTLSTKFGTPKTGASDEQKRLLKVLASMPKPQTGESSCVSYVTGKLRTNGTLEDLLSAIIAWAQSQDRVAEATG